MSTYRMTPYIWAFADRTMEYSESNSKVICVTKTEDFLMHGSISYGLQSSMNQILEDNGFYELMESFYEATFETEDQVRNALSKISFISYDSDLQKYMDKTL